MKLEEAIKQIKDSNHFNQTLRRASWTHGDSFQIFNEDGYMGGELYYKMSKHRAELFYVDDLIANDWIVE